MASSAAVPSLAILKKSVAEFISSSATFKIISSLPPSKFSGGPSKTLFILDSSFNPPTIAHLHLALSALQSPSPLYHHPRRLLLLLTTQNADKPVAPAAYEHRLAMMSFFAKELQDRLQSAGGNEQSTATPAIDIALTSQPYFYLKSKLITDSEAYIDKDYKNDEPLHVHLIGYDTLIRLLDTKYYPPSHSLSVLEPLFTSHRLRVHMRPGEWGETKKQYEWVARLAGSADEDGSLEKLGGKKEWVDKIELVGAEEGKGVGVSSSRVRKEASAEGSLDGLVPESITRFISEKGLYRD